MGAFGFVIKPIFVEMVAFVKRLSISCWSTYYRIARSIPNPKLDECIWYYVTTILATTRAENKFVVHLAIFKDALYELKKLGFDELWIPELFSG
jgi:predicted secreted hydrolase